MLFDPVLSSACLRHLDFDMDSTKLDQLIASAKARLEKSVGKDMIEKVEKHAWKSIAKATQKSGEGDSPEELGLPHESGPPRL